MSTVTIEQFGDYFDELHGHDPYPWQRRLAESAVNGAWPGAINLPTGSGKTACLDISIFALACQAALPVEDRRAPRRVFFCVNRRVIVDEAYDRARRIAATIQRAERDQGANSKPVLKQVAEALRRVSGAGAHNASPPLDALELRGGIYRDNRWARSITQPTIVCTTLDQLGSRLLFRGYGVSPNAAPIQAALIAYDSLILLDEAHISEPFRQTLNSARRYLDPERWAERPIGVRPVTVVPMTATPNAEMTRRGVIEISEDDRGVESLGNRLVASKTAELRDTKDLAKEATHAAIKLAAGEPAAVGIIVNRVATARAIYDRLRQERPGGGNAKRPSLPSGSTVELIVGSMRPVDRDEQAKRLRSLVGPDRPKPRSTGTCFVVATQCLEVGADYDFDVLITECASLDALRQRFGRLNRAGRSIDAKGVVLIDKKAVKPEDKLNDDKPLDPIYGNAQARTWNWLSSQAADGLVDFGIDAFSKLDPPPTNLLAPSASANAPAMMPAYVDLWCQTAPRPAPDPDVSLFIHGPSRGEPDVQVCWRADLIEDNRLRRDDWCDIVALLPPTSAECMSVPISRVRRWLTGETDKVADQGDVLGIGDAEGDHQDQDHGPDLKHAGVLWRGKEDSQLISSPDDLRPGDTIVLPASDEDSHILGHLPAPGAAVSVDVTDSRKPRAVNDVAEIAFARARDLTVLRLHPALRFRLPDGDAFGALLAAAQAGEPPTRREWSGLLRAAADAVADSAGPLKNALRHLATTGLLIESYPDRRGVVLTSRRRVTASAGWSIRAMDDGDDETSRIPRDAPVLLDDHSQHTHDAVVQSVALLPPAAWAEVLPLAANLHDLGKADERFQAMLRRSDRTDAWLLGGGNSTFLAKSDGLPQTPSQRLQACQRAGLPEGFRHEMLSAELAEHAEQLPGNVADRDLLLHLISAHHGYARPFAPVVFDEEPPGVEVDGVQLTHQQREAIAPPCRVDSGVAERFWTLTRRFGWWALAYLEAVLRLADQQASAREDAGVYDNKGADEPAEATT
jgi:CRISPR-associated endonuclease/helicase Cas3